jgi:N-acetylglucosamine kinase-like BadF-type ATPase
LRVTSERESKAVAEEKNKAGAEQKSKAGAEGLITPEQLRRVTEEKEKEKARAALEKKSKADSEQDQLRDAFMAREIHPEVFERISKAVKSAAERGEQELMVLRFSSEYCTDGGRAINSFEPDWPKTLTGFAKRAYEFWQEELEPQGYKLRAQIMDFPGGMPGDVGMFLKW